MRWKKHSAEEITAKLAGIREAAGLGVSVSAAIKAAGISEATYFRWRAHFGNLDASQVSVIKRLKLENARLRSALDEFEQGAAA